MNSTLLITIGLTVGVAVALKQVLAWFQSLDLDSQQQAAEHYLEDPSSLQKQAAPSVFGEATKSLSVIIPAYNEEDRLGSTLEETLRYLERRRDREGPNFTYEVIVVDDGSRDGTVKLAFEFVRRHGFDAVRVLRLPANCGKGSAVRAGMLIARGQLCLFMDADGATLVADVERLEAELKQATVPAALAPGAKPATRATLQKDGLGVAIGSRAHLQEQATAKRHWYRNFLMHGFHVLVMLVVGSGSIRDTQCGFKLFTRRSAAVLFSNLRLQRWCFDVELIYLAQRLHHPITEVSVNWTEIPGSKVKLLGVIHMAFELVSILVGYSWLRVWTARSEAEVIRTRA